MIGYIQDSDTVNIQPQVIITGKFVNHITVTNLTTLGLYKIGINRHTYPHISCICFLAYSFQAIMYSNRFCCFCTIIPCNRNRLCQRAIGLYAIQVICYLIWLLCKWPLATAVRYIDFRAIDFFHLRCSCITHRLEATTNFNWNERSYIFRLFVIIGFCQISIERKKMTHFGIPAINRVRRYSIIIYRHSAFSILKAKYRMVLLGIVIMITLTIN